MTEKTLRLIVVKMEQGCWLSGKPDVGESSSPHYRAQFSIFLPKPTLFLPDSMC